jgi:hypothetical protein
MNTEQLVNEVRIRFKHQEAKLYLQEKYTSYLIFTLQGGSWTATPELISFLRNSKPKTILVDNFKNPIEVDTKLLLEKMENVYDSVMQEWYTELTKLQGFR